jgi:hypothetical protein
VRISKSVDDDGDDDDDDDEEDDEWDVIGPAKFLSKASET